MLKVVHAGFDRTTTRDNDTTMVSKTINQNPADKSLSLPSIN